ncbi:hypothetical protein [Nocardia niigatensis]|uniref:hypothetical protein n=1 Tax=Nocardia niigatensis TaxID=209249 RepID=UPI0002FA80E2|nr:hypothetical protein [Nocardia niigatensis]
MSEQARKFRTRLREVEAMQWTGVNAEALATWTAGAFQPVDPEDRTDDPEASGQLLTGHHQTWQGVCPGDWIIRLAGMYFSLTADAFERTYSPVPVADDELAQLRVTAIEAIAETHRPGLFGAFGPSAWSQCIDIVQPDGPAGKYCAAAHPELVIKLLDERDHVRAELGRAVGNQLAVSARNDELRAQVSARDARIVELEEHAAGPVPWRCQATTTDPNRLFGTADQRAAWCGLPNDHAGMHHAELDSGAALFWPEVSGR